MAPSIRLATVTILAGLLFTSPSTAQTYSICNPTIQSGCPPNPALGRSVTIDFKDGPSDEFTTSGNPSYNSDGAVFTVASPGQAPTLSSKWYIMFGKYSITARAAPGRGIVSSSVLQSDDLDEIDWEWLGGEPNDVQSNYFGRGQTTTHDRAAVHALSNTQEQFHTYTTEWTENQIIWSIDNNVVRVLNKGDAKGQYPQTPMQLKIGSWAGGDSANTQGTIDWAGGSTDYSSGPFSMYVSTVSIVDYSTGTSYSYGDQSGSWESIVSSGGQINGNSKGSMTVNDAPRITSTVNGNPVSGWRSESEGTASYTTLPGLPSGWSISSSGKVVKSDATATPTPPTTSPSPSPAPPAPSSSEAAAVSSDSTTSSSLTVSPACISTRTWDDRGFRITAAVDACVTAAAWMPVLAMKDETELAAPSTLTADSSVPFVTEHIQRGGGSRVLSNLGGLFCTALTMGLAMGGMYILA
ncbi:uncharacterized protein MYCGRDRAFT_109870 [Zymoseptoria tritici IPO323]|uniref:chitinase n=1 Tax=Zymoseptoria tritici (strain CBS 115943 / IPO323) TaxID=336722 RepID=F9XDF6_ZYMTI|nr:uncharacterized protein MYCGRDRAFT_109870 [Zymoseptoria tritici IPO323]EGP86812.1 hypothetical protein MYCGRDRAFT_109870 [Zymoseptoria tritici IPO323]